MFFIDFYLPPLSIPQAIKEIDKVLQSKQALTMDKAAYKHLLTLKHNAEIMYRNIHELQFFNTNQYIKMIEESYLHYIIKCLKNQKYNLKPVKMGPDASQMMINQFQALKDHLHHLYDKNLGSTFNFVSCLCISTLLVLGMATVMYLAFASLTMSLLGLFLLTFALSLLMVGCITLACTTLEVEYRGFKNAQLKEMASVINSSVAECKKDEACLNGEFEELGSIDDFALLGQTF